MTSVVKLQAFIQCSAMNFKIAIVFLQLLTTSYGNFELACDSANPSAQTNLTCVCRRKVGNGIKWFFNGNSISNCIFNSSCLPQPLGYTFSTNVSEFTYEMTKSAYDYNDCIQINCTDVSNTNDQLMVVPSAINFDLSNPTSISEPALSHDNGNISITTGCISGYKEVTCKWYTVYNHGNPEVYSDGQSAFDKNDKSSCSNCNDDENGKKTCGFYHIEASGSETKNVTFRVVVTHTPTNLKWEINSTNVYTVKVNKPSEGDGPANNKLRNGLIALGVVIGIIVITVIIVIITLICVRPKLTNIKLEDKRIHLEWKDCLNCFCQRIFGYSIVRKPKKGQVTDITCKENVTKEKQCTLEQLDPMAIYEICLSRKFLCFRSFAQPRSVITRKLGMLNDQGTNAKPKTIDVWWTKPDCITNPQIKYKVTCNEEVTEENTGKTKSTIKGRMPKKTYKIEVFAIDDGTNSLLFAENITTTPLQVCLGDFCYKPGQSCVECNITWTVKDFDIQEHLNESDNFYFIVKWCIEGQEVDKREKIRASRYTIPKLYPKHSYTVYVYPVYHSVTFERAMIELTTPYKPTDLKAAAKSTEIALEWTKPDHTDNKQLQYLVTYNEYKCENINKASCKIKKLVPGQKYIIKIFTILNGIKSLPLEKEVWTPPLKVSIEKVWYEPGITCVECNIKWKLKDFDPPQTWKESDHLVFEITCDPVKQEVQGRRFKDRSYSKQFKLELSPNCPYSIKVYAYYHTVMLEHPGEIELPAPYIPTWVSDPTPTPTEIVLKWKKPECTGNQKLKYEVTCDKKIVAKTFDTSCKIENLKPLQSYNIQIFTIIDEKNEMKSLPLQWEIWTQPLPPKAASLPRKSGCQDPQKYFKLAPMGVTATSITVGWEEGFNGVHEQTFYVQINKEKEKKVNSKYKLRNKYWSYTWEKLEPNTDYNIEIWAENDEGPSKSCHLNTTTTNLLD